MQGRTIIIRASKVNFFLQILRITLHIGRIQFFSFIFESPGDYVHNFIMDSYRRM